MADEPTTLRDRDKKGFLFFLKWTLFSVVLYIALAGPAAMLRAKGSIPAAAVQVTDVIFSPVNWAAHQANPVSQLLLKYLNWCAAPPAPPAKP